MRISLVIYVSYEVCEESDGISMEYIWSKRSVVGENEVKIVTLRESTQYLGEKDP